MDLTYQFSPPSPASCVSCALLLSKGGAQPQTVCPHTNCISYCPCSSHIPSVDEVTFQVISVVDAEGWGWYALYSPPFNHYLAEYLFNPWSPNPKPSKPLFPPPCSSHIPSVDEVTSQVISVLDAEGAGKVCVMGHSYGSFVASRIAQLHQKRLHTLCVIDPVCFAMFMPYLLYNFIYRRPRLELQRWVGAGRVSGGAGV